MNIRRYQFLSGPVAIAVGAGLASALLFSLAGQGTWIGRLLACLAPLPIMISMLGFGRAIGIGALAAAIVAVVVLDPVFGNSIAGISTLGAALGAGLGFAFMLGLPALWLAYLASMSRQRGQPRWHVVAPSTSSYLREYAPIERILTAAVAIAATIVVLGLLVAALWHGSIDAAIDSLASALEEAIATSPRLPPGQEPRLSARTSVLMAVPVSAGMLLLVLLLNLWLAGRVALLSGRLPRPWPDIARELQLPRPYGLLLGVAFATTFIGGPAALIASIVAMALAVAFMLQGLAVVHVVSRTWKVRGLMLGIVYAGLMLLLPISFILLTILGLVESLHSFRNGKAETPPKI